MAKVRKIKKVSGRKNRIGKKVDRKKVYSHRNREQNLPVVSDVSEFSFLDDGQHSCRICRTPAVRFFVVECMARGLSLYKTRELLKKHFNFGITPATIREHIEKHDTQYTKWFGMVQYKFPTEEERKRYEAAFLSRVSIVTEMWDKYMVISKLFSMVVGDANKINENAVFNVDDVAKLSNVMKSYLESILKLQKERDIYVEVAKVVLFTMANNLVDRLSSLVMDLPQERRDAIGKAITEEVRAALDHAKNLGREKIEKLMEKVQDEYNRLVKKT